MNCIATSVNEILLLHASETSFSLMQSPLTKLTYSLDIKDYITKLYQHNINSVL